MLQVFLRTLFRGMKREAGARSSWPERNPGAAPETVIITGDIRRRRAAGEDRLYTAVLEHEKRGSGRGNQIARFETGSRLSPRLTSPAVPLMSPEDIDRGAAAVQEPIDRQEHGDVLGREPHRLDTRAMVTSPASGIPAAPTCSASPRSIPSICATNSGRQIKGGAARHDRPRPRDDRPGAGHAWPHPRHSAGPHGVAPFWPGTYLPYIAKRPIIIAPPA